jgi:hypothetical protein
MMIHAPQPRLSQVATVAIAFALLVAFIVFGALFSDDLIMFRVRASAWATTLLAAPALYQYARSYNDEPLDNWWRLFWTASFVMALIHTYYGLFHLYQGDLISLLKRQDWPLTIAFMAMLVLWLWDVITAWLRQDWQEDDFLSRRCAFWVAIIAFFLSTVLFANDNESLIIGLIITGAVLFGTLQRINDLGLWRDLPDSTLPPILITIVGLGAAFGLPFLLSTETLTTSESWAIIANATVWPAYLLGGIAAAIFIYRYPVEQDDWGWASWSIGGLLAYWVHMGVGFGHVHNWSLSAMIHAQGALVTWVSIALLALWSLSALAAADNRYYNWLHASTMGLFMATASAYAWTAGGCLLYFGGAFVAFWLFISFKRVTKTR